mgnify:CR=1 FL=1|jgi:hypothetical protein
MGIENLITLYRGQPWFGPSTMLNLENQGYGASNRFVNPSITGLDSFKNLTKDDLARLSGQYWTDNPRYAGEYAGNTGKIKSMNIPLSDLDKFSRFENKVTRLPSGKYVHAGNPAGAYLVPKSTLTKYNPKLNIGRTIQNLAKDFDYPFKHGLQWTTTRNPITKLMDEGRILKAGWDLYEDATLGERLSGVGKHISKSGLAFLRNNALKGLGYLGSIPASAALMTLSPTKLGSAELPLEKMAQQRAQATSAQDKQNIQKIHQHTGEALSDYRMSKPTSERQYTGHGKSGMGRDRSELMATGGIVDVPLPGRSRYI